MDPFERKALPEGAWLKRAAGGALVVVPLGLLGLIGTPTVVAVAPRDEVDRALGDTPWRGVHESHGCVEVERVVDGPHGSGSGRTRCEGGPLVFELASRSYAHEVSSYGISWRSVSPGQVISCAGEGGTRLDPTNGALVPYGTEVRFEHRQDETGTLHEYRCRTYHRRREDARDATPSEERPDEETVIALRRYRPTALSLLAGGRVDLVAQAARQGWASRLWVGAAFLVLAAWLHAVREGRPRWSSLALPWVPARVSEDGTLRLDRAGAAVCQGPMPPAGTSVLVLLDEPTEAPYREGDPRRVTELRVGTYDDLRAAVAWAARWRWGGSLALSAAALVAVVIARWG
ncbi:MAG: hypothetical protein HY909_10970 [Deltaproteobacteria bacterium]|nr:hypothetical protein [Deltaproteobacteria bacterium]